MLEFIQQYPMVDEWEYTYMHQWEVSRAFFANKEIDDLIHQVDKAGNYNGYPSMNRGGAFAFKEVHYDEKGAPITKKDKENHAWNVKWLKGFLKIERAADQQEKQAAIAEQQEAAKQAFEDFYRRIKAFKLPSLEEVKNGWLQTITPEQMREFVDLARLNTAFGINRPETPELHLTEMVEEFYRQHPDFKIYTQALTDFTSYYDLYFTYQTGIERSRVRKDKDGKYMMPDTYQAKQTEAGKAGDKEQAEIFEGFYDKSQAMIRYSMFMNKKDNPEATPSKNVIEEAEKNRRAFVKKYPDVPDYVYMFTYYKKQKSRIHEHPEMEKKFQELARIDAKYNGGQVRECGIGLKDVNYDENWKPITEEDRKNHEWNINWVDTILRIEHAKQNNNGQEMAVAKTDLATKAETSFKDFLARLKKFPFPTPEELENGWLESLPLPMMREQGLT